MSKCACCVCKVAFLLLVLGGINWGLIGAFQIDVIAKVFGTGTMFTRVIYMLVGAAGLVKLLTCFKECPKCCDKDQMARAA